MLIPLILHLGGDEGKKRRLPAAGPTFNVAVNCKKVAKEGYVSLFIHFFLVQKKFKSIFFKFFSGASFLLLF